MISAPTDVDARVRSAFSSSSDSTRSSGGGATSDSAATALLGHAVSTSKLILRRAESAAHLGVPALLEDDASIYSQPSRPTTPIAPTPVDRSLLTPKPLPLDSDPTTIVNAAGWSRPVNSSHSSLDVLIGDAGTAAVEPPGPGPKLERAAPVESETAEVMLELAIQELDDVRASFIVARRSKAPVRAQSPPIMLRSTQSTPDLGRDSPTPSVTPSGKRRRRALPGPPANADFEPFQRVVVTSDVAALRLAPITGPWAYAEVRWRFTSTS